jgi:hypothetical protein
MLELWDICVMDTKFGSKHKPTVLHVNEYWVLSQKSVQQYDHSKSTGQSCSSLQSFIQ